MSAAEMHAEIVSLYEAHRHDLESGAVAVAGRLANGVGTCAWPHWPGGVPAFRVEYGPNNINQLRGLSNLLRAMRATVQRLPDARAAIARDAARIIRAKEALVEKYPEPWTICNTFWWWYQMEELIGEKFEQWQGTLRKSEVW